jgi:thiol-disulfide isomerase/thioredoxin
MLGKLKEMFSNIKNKSSYVFILIGIIILCVVAYVCVKQFSRKSSTKYVAKPGDVPPSIATLKFFYVDWCPYCKTAKPEWDAVKAEYENKIINGYQVQFDEINCTNENVTITTEMAKYKVEGYPTIVLIKDGKTIEYDAKPNKETIEQFLNMVL